MNSRYKTEEVDDWFNDKEWKFSIYDRKDYGGNISCYYGLYKQETIVRGLILYWKRKTYWFIIGGLIWDIWGWYIGKVCIRKKKNEDAKS